jgi:hypothetical protein
MHEMYQETQHPEGIGSFSLTQCNERCYRRSSSSRECSQAGARVSLLAENTGPRLKLRFHASRITVSSFAAPRTIDPSAKKPLTLDETATPSKQALERAFAPVCAQLQELSQALALLDHLRRFSLAW